MNTAANQNLASITKRGAHSGTIRKTVKQEEYDYFFKTIQSRGFANKMTPQMVQLRAQNYDYATLC
jgi:uncharacterized protein (UPF0335 family)